MITLDIKLLKRITTTTRDGETATHISLMMGLAYCIALDAGCATSL